MKFFLKNFYWILSLGWIFWTTVDYRITEYKAYMKYNNMPGIVIDNFVSSGRYSSTSLPTIRLQDGTVDNINGGDRNYNIGDTIYNNMRYNWIAGEYGSAYAINPYRSTYKIVTSLIALAILGVVSMFMIYVAIIIWDDFIEARFLKKPKQS